MIKKANTSKRKRASKESNISFDVIELLDDKVNKRIVFCSFILLIYIIKYTLGYDCISIPFRPSINMDCVSPSCIITDIGNLFNIIIVIYSTYLIIKHRLLAEAFAVFIALNIILSYLK